MKIFVLLFILINSYLAYCQDSLTNKNILKISILSVVDNAKFQYEHVIYKNSTIGLNTSFFYLPPVIGIKIEPAFRYYFKQHAPTGWYVEPKLSVGYFKTNEIFNTNSTIYNSNDSLLYATYDENYFKTDVKFIPFGATIKFGIQKYISKDKRFVFDFNLGFQHFLYNYFPKKRITEEYKDINGNKHIDITKPGGSESFPWNDVFWYSFGAGSIFQTNISIGYNF